MYQVWDLHPNFITDWIDSSAVAAAVSLPDALMAKFTMATDRGVQVNQEVMINLNPTFIVIFMIPLSWLVRKMRTLTAMAFGMIIATFGIFVTGMTMSGWVFLGGLIFFSIGEMMTGPKKNEYLGLIAPPGKKAMYLGYVNIPVGLGVFVGSYLAGYLYGHFGDKAVLAQKYLLQHTELGAGMTWDGSPAALTELLGVERTEAMQVLQETLGMDGVTATQLLWDTYHPHLYVWTPFIAIGIVATIALVIYGQLAKRWSDMNA
jgi:MFS family permease